MSSEDIIAGSADPRERFGCGSFFVFLFVFVFVVLGLEFRAFTLSHCASPIFVIGSRELFA
jgi:hypothetical protein